MAFTRNRVRLALDVVTPFVNANGSSAILDVFLNSSPLIPHARAAQFEIALFQNRLLDAATGLDSLTLELKTAAAGVIDLGAPVLSQTVGSVDFNGLLKKEEWEAGTAYYAAFTFSEAQMNLSMAGAVDNRKQFGLVVSGMGAFGRVDCGSGIVTLVQSGATGLGSGDPPVPTYSFSDQELTAALKGRLKLGVNDAGASFILPAINSPGKGLLIFVEDPGDGGECVLQRQQVVIPP